jgi:hypothetical protein
MFRRRRPPKNDAIQFSFDSFLDLVTNVVGIIIRLILVTWVGARSYHASMQMLDVEPLAPDAPALTVSDDPLHARIEQSKNDLDDAKTRLLAYLKDFESTNTKAFDARAHLVSLSNRRDALEAELKALEVKNAQRGIQVQQASLSVENVRLRSRKLLDDLKKLEAEPTKRKQLKYHAPVSRVVQSEELFFECKAGRVTYIDLPAFMEEIKRSMDGVENELKSSWRVERKTGPSGAFQLRYTIERQRSVLDPGATPTPGNFSYGLSEWSVEPIVSERGETLPQALAEKSEFRQLVDPIDANLTTVTFWVYPDSFELFRHLRDHLYERGHDVAGRPLPPGAPIAASRNGTASRGQ